jgi:hypothetical protein
MYSENNCPSITSSTLNLTLSGPGSDLGFLCDRLATTCLKFIYVVHKNSVQTSERTHLSSITKKKEWISFREIIVIYFENHTKQMQARKVAGSIPDGVIGIFYLLNSSGRTMAVGSTQLLPEISNRYISWRVKAAGA